MGCFFDSLCSTTIGFIAWPRLWKYPNVIIVLLKAKTKELNTTTSLKTIHSKLMAQSWAFSNPFTIFNKRKIQWQAVQCKWSGGKFKRRLLNIHSSGYNFHEYNRAFIRQNLRKPNIFEHEFAQFNSGRMYSDIHSGRIKTFVILCPEYRWY